MDTGRAKQIAFALAKADSEATVVRLLGDARYWDNSASWRFYGDRETNFNTTYGAG